MDSRVSIEQKCVDEVFLEAREGMERMELNVKRMAVVAFAAAALVLVGAGAASAQGVDLGPGLSTANNATGGGLEAAAVGQMGNTQFDEASAVPVLDLPALNVDQDAQGRIRMDLPGLTLFGPSKAAAPPVAPPAAPGPGPALPKTGVSVVDVLAMGMAALTSGGLLVRRLRLSFFS
jgi:LPXTG-motif cell wall-anchored protein